MGHLIMTSLVTGKTEILGDEKQARAALDKHTGQPYTTPAGKYRSQEELDAIDKEGE